MESIKEFIVDYENMSDLARRMGLHRSHIYLILDGKREPGMKFVEGLMRAGMKPREIFDMTIFD